MPSRDLNLPLCEDIHINKDGVVKPLRDLNPPEASGPDGITLRILKEMIIKIASALTLLYQTSLDTKVVTSERKTANVTPLFKKGARYKAENYRPISFTSVPCKILEHILVSTIMG